MKPQHRPTAVIVLAVINFVLAGLVLLFGVCGTLLSILVFPRLMASFMPPGQGPNPFTMMSEMMESIPGYNAFMLGKTGLNAVTSTLLLVAGFGLLKVRRWSRTLCLVYAVVTIVQTLAATVYEIAVLNPAVSRAVVEYTEKVNQMNKAPGQPPVNLGFTETLYNTVGPISAVLWAVVLLVYPITLLIVLTRRPIVAAFARGEVLEALPAEPDERETGITGRPRP